MQLEAGPYAPESGVREGIVVSHDFNSLLPHLHLFITRGARVNQT